MQGVLYHDIAAPRYALWMAKKAAATSRGGNRMREANPQHPVARYCLMAREALKLTPADMAKKFGLSRTAWYQYENGTVLASTEALLKMSKETKLSLGIISAFDGNPDILALAEKIARAPPDVQKLIERAFSEPVDDKRVEGAGYKPVRWV